jgi:SAM-dependent methyltransferase
MALDHSATYRRFRLRNIPHIKRLNDIKALIAGLDVPKGASYADFGCSNGYVTDEVRKLVGAARAYGFDHLDEHFEEGRKRHPELLFETIDLNVFDATRPQFDLVTCFETLEHTGHLENAVRSVVHAIRPGGVGVISVPVEVGLPGIVKFAVKVGLYRYKMTELPQRPGLRSDYIKTLLKGGRISSFRSESRPGWSTHFGFDSRDVDDILARQGVSVTGSDRAFTRFWVIRKPAVQ